MDLNVRMRRLRHNTRMRDMIRQTYLQKEDFILPLFVQEGKDKKVPITAIPGAFRYTVDRLPEKISSLKTNGVQNILLFGITNEKDERGGSSLGNSSLIVKAIKTIKKEDPSLFVISDICLCSYTDTGHCGIMKEIAGVKDVDNDKTLKLIGEQALAHADAGVDMVAPSGMMDGAVLAIRQILDAHHMIHVPIMGYSIKYASHMYSAFRAATACGIIEGTRSTHQADFSNKDECLREAMLDIEEGADLIMVKPAHTYLDILTSVKREFPYIPLVAYHTSGECAMLTAAIERGWLSEEAIFEVLVAIKRAGADVIISYFSEEIIRFLNVQ